jgi:hypothetical protein
VTSPQEIACRECAKHGVRTKAVRVGAQDACDVYVCESILSHVVRVPVESQGEPWREAAQ